MAKRLVQASFKLLWRFQVCILQPGVNGYLGGGAFDRRMRQAAASCSKAHGWTRVLLRPFVCKEPSCLRSPVVVTEALKVLDIVEELTGAKFEREFDLCGGTSIDKHKDPVTEEVLRKCEAADAVFFGSCGGPEWYGSRIPQTVDQVTGH
nr:3-isopropylmalate dehydrogenase [Quercus suber]